ncbi:MAG: pyridoxamine 5'-phosphate oxidase family protein [Lachnospiraceae bacterium]|nr:pyridoxamine 5'-phosphate oxidase family protein [Lachnospiraceae bacterium]
MNKIYEFLKEAGTYYLATDENGQPRVRPFGTIHLYENRLYIQTGKGKAVAKQMLENPKVEICAMKNGEWIRVSGTVALDDRVEAQESMLDAYPSLRSMYTTGPDGNTAVFYFTEGTATISSFTHEPVIVELGE